METIQALAYREAN